MRHRSFVIVCLALLVAGCSLLPQQEPLPPTLAKQEQLKHWQVSGKVGIRTAEDAGSAYLRWQQQKDHYQIRLHGPLGQGALDIEGTPKKVVARSQKFGEISAPTPEQLFYEHFGWWMPLSDLKTWIRGLPTPQRHIMKTVEYDEQGLIKQFQQRGWHIEYRSYQDVDGVTLPRKIVLTQQDITITLVLKEWHLSAPA